MTEGVSAPAGDGLRASVAIDGAMERVLDVRPPDVARLPGVSLEGFEVHRAPGGVTVQLGCARGPGDRWVPGLEGAVLERATALALGPLQLRPTALERSTAPSVPGATATEAWLGRADGDRRVALAHVLAFDPGDGDAVVCSVVCVEPSASAACTGVAGSFRLAGSIGPPPPPGILARAVLWSADHPAQAAAVAGVAAALVVAGLLARRPRRPIASRRARAARR